MDKANELAQKFMKLHEMEDLESQIAMLSDDLIHEPPRYGAELQDKDGFINADWSEVVIYNGTDSIDYQITIDGIIDYPTAFGTYELDEIFGGNDITYNLTMSKIQNNK